MPLGDHLAHPGGVLLQVVTLPRQHHQACRVRRRRARRTGPGPIDHQHVHARLAQLPGARLLGPARRVQRERQRHDRDRRRPPRPYGRRPWPRCSGRPAPAAAPAIAPAARPAATSHASSCRTAEPGARAPREPERLESPWPPRPPTPPASRTASRSGASTPPAEPWVSTSSSGPRRLVDLGLGRAARGHDLHGRRGGRGSGGGPAAGMDTGFDLEVDTDLVQRLMPVTRLAWRIGGCRTTKIFARTCEPPSRPAGTSARSTRRPWSSRSSNGSTRASPAACEPRCTPPEPSLTPLPPHPPRKGGNGSIPIALGSMGLGHPADRHRRGQTGDPGTAPGLGRHRGDQSRPRTRPPARPRLRARAFAGVRAPRSKEEPSPGLRRHVRGSERALTGAPEVIFEGKPRSPAVSRGPSPWFEPRGSRGRARRGSGVAVERGDGPRRRGPRRCSPGRSATPARRPRRDP